MTKILTGYAIIKDGTGNRISYVYSEIDEKGMIVNSNVKESFVVLEEGTLDILTQLEVKIKERF
jgi:hypothetical protein